MIGAVTVFVDILDNPILTLGLPLLVFIIRFYHEGRSMAECFVFSVQLALFWLAGYCYLWCIKWLLAIAVMGSQAFERIYDSVSFRLGIGERASSYDTSAVIAIKKNIRALGWVFYLVLPVLLIALAFSMLSFIRFQEGRSRFLIFISLLGLTALLPYCWYIVFSNHSAIHAGLITYRNQLVTLFAVGVFFIESVLRLGFCARQKEGVE